ncbi:hypothetical protein [Alloalcanivorax mobilis]|uniref:hypothetical protein n=1 Tax=Alloalcanivorax mobilis TaxID=2019569 RepID=UPI000C7597FE|nr:hypothetical protein [Alloalcanivorax mobilis]
MKRNASPQGLSAALLLTVLLTAAALTVPTVGVAQNNSVGAASQQMRDNAENRSEALRDANRARGELIREQSRQLREETRQRVQQQNQEARERQQRVMERTRGPIGELGH